MYLKIIVKKLNLQYEKTKKNFHLRKMYLKIIVKNLNLQ